MDAKRFRIALSFAGKKRDFVAKVAAILAGRLGEESILYDAFYEARFARSDLGIYLPDLYYHESELVVVVHCAGYEEKDWCGLEWTAIHALIQEHRVKDVMLCRFDHALVKGLYPGAGFAELDDKTPEQTATLILERLADNEGKPKDHYTREFALPTSSSGGGGAPPATSTPNNLPRLQPFFGREAELQTIREALAPGAQTWGVLIVGPGGMGKTSLAVRAAYQCPPGLFGRIIFVSVKARKLDAEGERSLGAFLVPGFLEMLNVLARELGQPDIAKSAEDQRIPLLLDALRPAQALLILDNLESLPKSDRDQLLSFVEQLPQGCKVILTSRRLIGSGAEALLLEPFDQEAALATLAELATHNKLLARTSDPERIALYEQTGGKPLLLRWVAGQLGRGSCRTFADALAFLRSCPPGNDPLEFIFGDLAQEFVGGEEKALCALSFFSRPAKVAQIAGVAELGENDALTALRTLANRALITPDQEETRYALVPMVAEFLRRHRPGVVAASGERLEQSSYALIVENGFEKYERFPVLNDAWGLVESALPLLVAGPSERLQIVCRALESFLEFTGRWDEWRSLELQGEAKAVAAGDFRQAGWRARQSAWPSFLRQQAAEVVAGADRAAQHWEQAEAGPNERANALFLRGQGHGLQGDHPAAIADYRAALKLIRKVPDASETVVAALNSLAGEEVMIGKHQAAEKHYKEALRVARAGGYAEMLAGIPCDLAQLALERKAWKQAEELLRKALPLCEKVGRQELIGGACQRLAKALAKQGKEQEARPYAERAVEIFTRLCSPRLEAAQTLLDSMGTATA